jgi:hypothetical protein
MKFAVGNDTLVLAPELLIVAGFTGRDQADTERHLEELNREGIATPAEIPAFYVVPSHVAAQAETVDVLHSETSGEVEIALLCKGGDIHVTLASDHTDRQAETQDIGLSKQLCPKILASVAWPLDEVLDHWDTLSMRSWLETKSGRQLYQEGTAASLLNPTDLLSRLKFISPPSDFVVLGGTVPAIGGIRPSSRFWAELRDPVLDRTINFDYRVQLVDPWALGDG